MRPIALIAILSAPAWACSCVGSPSAKDAWLDSPLVFIGVVDKTNPTLSRQGLMSGHQSAWVRVTEPFKGVKKDQVLELRDQFSSCFAGFLNRTTILFYLHPGEKAGTWVAPPCHRSRSLDEAADDLKFLRGLPASAQGNRVSGGSYRIVVNRDGRLTAEEPFGRLYYPGTPDVEKAGVLTVAAGQHRSRADIHIPKLAPRIELRGRLIFNDGVPLPNQWLDFRASVGTDHQRGRTDANGNFAIQILSGRVGELTGEISIWRELEGACPQFRAKFHPNGFAASLKSTPYPIAVNASLFQIEVMFPFPSCDAWLKREAERNTRK